MQLECTIRCPRCSHLATEQMPTDACQFFYDCKGCGARLKPKPGDCCVFCSYGSVPCPPIQARHAGASDAAPCRSLSSTMSNVERSAVQMVPRVYERASNAKIQESA